MPYKIEELESWLGLTPGETKPNTESKPWRKREHPHTPPPPPANVDVETVWRRLPKHVRRRIERPHSPDRSAEVHWAACRLFELGHSVDQVFAILAARSAPAMSKYGPRLHDEVERCWWKWLAAGGCVEVGPDFGAGGRTVEFDFTEQVERIARTAGARGKEGSVFESGQAARANGADRPEDFLRTAEELRELIDQWSTDVTKLGERKADDFLVDGLLIKKTIAVLFGEPGTIKSFLTNDLCWHLQTGTPWLGREVEACSSLYIALESRFQHEDSFRNLSNRKSARQTNYTTRLYDDEFTLDSEACVNTLTDRLKNEYADCGLCVIDNLSLAGGNLESTDIRDQGPIMNAALRIVRETGVTLLFVHHPPRSNPRRISGGAKIDQTVSTSICSYFIGDKQKQKFGLELQKQRGAPGYFQLAEFTTKQQAIGWNEKKQRDIVTVEPKYLKIFEEGDFASKRGAPKNVIKHDAFTEAVQQIYDRIDDEPDLGNQVEDGVAFPVWEISVDAVREQFKRLYREASTAEGSKLSDKQVDQGWKDMRKWAAENGYVIRKEGRSEWLQMP